MKVNLVNNVKTLFIGIISLLTIVTIVNVTAAERLLIWGSTTCQKRFIEPGNDALIDATGISVKVVGVGTGRGLLSLIKGKTEVSASSESLNGSVELAKKILATTGEELNIPNDLIYHEIHNDSIVTIVHKDNPINITLTLEQLKGLNTGKIKNWKEIGGLDLPVRVITSHVGSATRSVYKRIVMQGQEYTKDAIRVRSTRIEIDEVSKYQGAIGAVSEGFYKLNSGKAKVLQTKMVSRPLGLITRGEPQGAVKKVIDFYQSDEGRKYLR
jgi:phosphate transport system substrate-binding protein